MSQDHGPYLIRLGQFEGFENVCRGRQYLDASSHPRIHPRRRFAACTGPEEVEICPSAGCNGVNGATVGDRRKARFFNGLRQGLFSWCVTSSGIGVQDMVFGF